LPVSLFLSLSPLSISSPFIESTLHRGLVAPVSTPNVLCTLWWGLAQKNTSFMPGPPLDPEFFFFQLDQHDVHQPSFLAECGPQMQLLNDGKTVHYTAIQGSNRDVHGSPPTTDRPTKNFGLAWRHDAASMTSTMRIQWMHFFEVPAPKWPIEHGGMQWGAPGGMQ
jgi:hypothetical protein